MLSTLVSRPRVAVLAALAALAVPAGAQRALPQAELPVAGGEWERYARALQLIGAIAPRPWAVRGFGPAELARLAPADTGHPWRARPLPARGAARRALGVVAPEARLLYNTAFPFGQNDGAVWAGRGATLVASAGAVAALGPVTLTLAPTLFVAQNRAFPLMPTGEDGEARFRNGPDPASIDQPQRFGPGRYARVDWGQSTMRVDARGVSAGLSTANQMWGPAVDHPVILGTNAPGFAHLFLGTARPLDVWVGRVHGRLVWGSLEQSAYSPIDSIPRRFASGLVATFTPRWVPGLELGGARFFHTAWPDGGVGGEQLWKPLEGFLKRGLRTTDNPTGNDPDNQLASVFARWAFPRASFEVYAEYGREDHSEDGRDFALQPDHDAAFVLGAQRAWRRPGRLVVGRAEVLNSRQTHLSQARHQAPFYVHSFLKQGHTHRGQVLGSAGAYGGGAGVLAADVYHGRGRWSVNWSRTMRAEHERSDPVSGLPDFDRADVLHALGADALLFRGGHELMGGLAAVKNFNRDFARDAWNVNASLGVRLRW